MNASYDRIPNYSHKCLQTSGNNFSSKRVNFACERTDKVKEIARYAEKKRRVCRVMQKQDFPTRANEGQSRGRKVEVVASFPIPPRSPIPSTHTSKKTPNKSTELAGGEKTPQLLSATDQSRYANVS